jgi:AcrR family transcriptional regulator
MVLPFTKTEKTTLPIRTASRQSQEPMQVSACTQINMQVYACMDDDVVSKRIRVQNGSADLTRNRILDAAEHVFSRDGFQGATTREIAREAGVNEVTIFRHFHTRDELLHSTLKRSCASIDALMQPDDHWAEDLFGRLERYVGELYTLVREKEALVRAFIGEAPILPESTRHTLQEFMLKRKALFVARLKEAQDAGLVRTGLDLSAAADFIRDAVHSAMLRHTAYGDDAESITAHLRGITDIFYQGIKA